MSYLSYFSSKGGRDPEHGLLPVGEPSWELLLLFLYPYACLVKNRCTLYTPTFFSLPAFLLHAVCSLPFPHNEVLSPFVLSPCLSLNLFFPEFLHFPPQRTLADIEEAFYGIFANFPSKTLSLAMRGVAFPTGRCYSPPSDTLSQEVSQIISTDTAVRAAAAIKPVHPQIIGHYCLVGRCCSLTAKSVMMREFFSVLGESR